MTLKNVLLAIAALLALVYVFPMAMKVVSFLLGVVVLSTIVGVAYLYCRTKRKLF